MAKTSRDARRHIKEWGKFFADLKEASNSLVEDFLDKHEKSKYLKQSLERMIARGLVVQKNNKLIPTKKGFSFFGRLSRSKNQKIEKWDGHWFLVSFDVPVNSNKSRDQLRRLLRRYYFYPLQKSVWICPNQLTEDFWELVVENNLHRFCKAMVVKVIEGGDDLRKHYRGILTN